MKDASTTPFQNINPSDHPSNQSLVSNSISVIAPFIGLWLQGHCCLLYISVDQPCRERQTISLTVVNKEDGRKTGLGAVSLQNSTGTTTKVA